MAFSIWGMHGAPALSFGPLDLNLIIRGKLHGTTMLTRKTNRLGRTVNPPLRRTSLPAKAAVVGVSDEDLRKMTAAVLEKLKSPTIPPSVTILDALKLVRDCTHAAHAGATAARGKPE
jgi:hypothetical protein